MSKEENSKRYDLEDRTYEFARRVRAFVKDLPRTVSNREDVKQLVRASGSIAANYIEANESLSRKESKESRLFLRLVDVGTEAAVARERVSLVQEAMELTSILGAIIRKSE